MKLQKAKADAIKIFHTILSIHVREKVLTKYQSSKWRDVKAVKFQGVMDGWIGGNSHKVNDPLILPMSSAKPSRQGGRSCSCFQRSLTFKDSS